MPSSETPQIEHLPCKHRIKGEINGCPVDLCGAICFEQLGDLPCEFCNEWKKNDTVKGSKDHAET